jgi:hypothetical protein
MNERLHLFNGGVATARKPRLVVAGAIGVAGKAANQLHMHGWEIVNVPTSDAVRAALTRKPTAMLLPDETAGESGFLIAAKVLEARRKLRVVLVGSKRTPKAERFAKFIGAGFIAESDGVHKLLAALEC